MTQEMWRVPVIYAILGSLVALAWWAQRHPESAVARALFKPRGPQTDAPITKGQGYAAACSFLRFGLAMLVPLAVILYLLDSVRSARAQMALLVLLPFALLPAGMGLLGGMYLLVRTKRIGDVSTAGYSIELQRSGRDKELTYREDGKELRVWLELTGFFAPYNHGGATQDLEQWTQPAREPIPEAHQALIRSRIEQWASDQRLSIGFARGQTLEEYFAQMERDGYRRELRPDGSELWHPPPRRVLLKQLWRRIRGRT